MIKVSFKSDHPKRTATRPGHIASSSPAMQLTNASQYTKSLLIGLDLGDLILDALVLLGLGQLVLLVLQALLLPLLLGLLLALILILLEGVLTDLLVCILVELLKTVGLNVVINVSLELGLVALLIVVGKSLHVLGHVTCEDVLAESLGVKLLALNVETREALLGVRDVETTVRGTLHGTKDTGTSGSANKTDVEETLEWAACLTVNLGLLGELVLSISLLDSSEGLVKVELLEGTASEKKSDRVGGSPVGDTVGDAVTLQLVAVGSHEDLVAGDLRGDDLSNDVAVGEADDQAVLWCIVLVLGLGDEPLAGIVVGLSGSSALVLDLVAPECVRRTCLLISRANDLREVRRVLDQLGLFNPRVSNLRFSVPTEASCRDSTISRFVV